MSAFPDLSQVSPEECGTLSGSVYHVWSCPDGQLLEVSIDDRDGDAHLIVVRPENVYPDPAALKKGQQVVATVVHGEWYRGMRVAKRISVFVDPLKPEPVEPLAAPWVWPPAPHDLVDRALGS